MSIRILSIFWYHFKFVFSAYKNFHSTNFSLLLLNLFQDIFEAMVNHIISFSLFFLLVCQSFVYRKVMIFMLILYNDILLNVFISYRNFLMWSLSSFIYTTVSCINKNNLTSSLPIRIPFISSCFT